MHDTSDLNADEIQGIFLDQEPRSESIFSVVICYTEILLRNLIMGRGKDRIY